jgi:4-azaleucine resistance transporter AzlC
VSTAAGTREPSLRLRDGALAAAPIMPAAALFGASFAVLAHAADFDSAAAIIMSGTTFAGSAQFAAVSILGAGGGVVPAIAAAILLNARYAPIGISVAGLFRGTLLRRIGEAQLIVDESWAMSSRSDGGFDRSLLLGAGAALWVAWTGGTAVGALAGEAVGDPNALGLDGAFPALFFALLLPHARTAAARAAAIAGAAIAVVLVPLTPPGIPVIGACAACLLGWRR